MIMKTNIVIGPKKGASPNEVNTNLKGGPFTGGRSIATRKEYRKRLGNEEMGWLDFTTECYQ